MVIKNELIYEPNIKILEKEEDVISLIKDVRKDLSGLSYPNSPLQLKDVLKMIESGKHEYSREGLIVNSVDLSKAKCFIDQYKHFSEGGCQSCNNLKISRPFPDEIYKSCKLEKETSGIGLSPMIDKFYKTGCESRDAIFSKSLDRLLEEAEKK